MQLGHVDPVLLGRQRTGEGNIALPEGDGLLGIHFLVDEGEVVERAGILAIRLDHLAVLPIAS